MLVDPSMQKGDFLLSDGILTIPLMWKNADVGLLDFGPAAVKTILAFLQFKIRFFILDLALGPLPCE
jgi:hypothetical protein